MTTAALLPLAAGKANKVVLVVVCCVIVPFLMMRARARRNAGLGEQRRDS